jgi:hypothetical protein
MDATQTFAIAKTGTLKSVGIQCPPIFTVSGSPVTENGVINIELAPQTKNVVFAGPSSGTDAAPAFRALVPNDVPKLTEAQLPDTLDEGTF